MFYLPNHGKEFEQVGGIVQFGFARVSNVLEFQPSPDNFTFPVGDLHSLVTSIGSLQFSRLFLDGSNLRMKTLK